MTVLPDPEVACRLGRGVIVAADAPAPEPWAGAPRVTISDAELRSPASAVDTLHAHWSTREPVVVEMRADANELRAAEVNINAPYALTPRFEFAKERLYYLARANNYDNRDDKMVWGPGVEALRLGATEATEADVTLHDGRPAWCDGGPRANAIDVPTLVHRNTIEQGLLTPDRAASATGELAEDQLAAVLHDAGPARIIAPAGSGKTRVLTERLKLLIARNWSPQSITAVAYNVRAKDTMRHRLAGLPEPAINRVRTLHALGNAILTQANGRSTLIDEWDVRRRIEALVPIKPRANTDMYAPYIEALSAVRLGLIDPNVVEAQRDDVAGFAAMFEEYREKLHADGAIDHDEQIYGAVEALLRAPQVRRAFQRECRHLLVDEFQDLTPTQLLMLRLVGAPAYDVFGVGDDDQVIYGYAGADPEFLINYDRYFPGGTHHALNTNYRCPARVVDAARNVLSYNRRRIDKAIVAAKPDDAGETITTARAAPERLALLAIEQATTWLTNGAQPEELAVLARVNASLLPVQILLQEANVPCWTPVSVAVLNRTGTRTALAYLRLALAAATGNGLPGSDIAIAARRPSRSIRREILQRFERRRSWTYMQMRETMSGANASAVDKFEIFLSDLALLGKAVDTGATTADLLVRIRDEVGLGAALATLDLSGKGPDASHRDDLNALIAVATFEPDPAAFEPWLRSRLRDQKSTPGTDGVAVSTVHRVKGMEWPYVIVLGAHDGLMPHALADDFEEERRIFHVAITRGDTAVHVLADKQAPAPFVDEMNTPAPADYQSPRSNRRTVEAVRPNFKVVVEADGPVVEALKVWRKKRASADGVPAYIVLSDAHLNGIAAKMPSSLDELARCAGIGPTKLERYGDEIVAALADVR